MRKPWLACVLVLAGCPDVSKDSNELTPIPTVEFDPANAIVPFPNNLALDPTTGKVNLPAQACESPAQTQIRTQVLNRLDGFGTYELIMTTTVNVPPDPTSITPTDFVMYKIATNGMPENPATATAVPVVAVATKTLRFSAADCTMPAMVDTIAVVPQARLDEHSTYVVAVTTGLKAMGASGSVDYNPSPTWALVRQATEPVTVDQNGNIVANRTPINPSDPTDANMNGVPDGVEQLRQLDQVWKLHAPGLAFLDATGKITSRDQVLVAWTFNTQTTTDPLDPSVAGSPAANEPTTKPDGLISLNQQAGAPDAATFLAALGVPCGSLPCNAVGEVFGGQFSSPSYQVLGPNPLPGGAMIPGQWNDPVHPTVVNSGQALQFVAAIPKTAPPPAGYPLVVFGHGLGSSKESLVAIGPQLAAAGFASIAIDFQAHGSRAVRDSVDPALGCAGTCSVTTTTQCTQASDCPTGESCKNGAGVSISPTTTQQCYAPFLSLDLGALRDNIRQTVLDLQRLTLAAKACGVSGCVAVNGTRPAFPIDPNHIVYMGISLGGIIGTTTSAVAGFQGSVLNVPGVGWVDIVENTNTLAIKCPVINELIDLGIVMGAKWDPSNPTVGECTTDDWKMQPGYQQFAAIARWTLDPADGANFTPKLASRKFVIQEVQNDQTVPNVATNHEGLLLALSAANADPYNPLVSNPPSAAITTNPNSSKWVIYATLPANNAGTGGFGNAYHHASLLQPASDAPGHCIGDPATTCTMNSECAAAGNVCVFPGPLGTARMQLDAITYLLANH